MYPNLCFVLFCFFICTPLGSLCFRPLMWPGILFSFPYFKIKWISFVIFLLWKWRIFEKKRKTKTNVIQLCTTGIMPYNKCVIYTEWRGIYKSLIFGTPQHCIRHGVSSQVRHCAILFHTQILLIQKWMVTRHLWREVRIIVNLWTPFSCSFHSFHEISWVWFVCWGHFSFITVASIGVYLHFSSYILQYNLVRTLQRESQQTLWLSRSPSRSIFPPCPGVNSVAWFCEMKV